jgi:hypothetical protein
MSAYRGLVSPPVFWPMLLFVEAAARGRAGTPGAALPPLDEAIALMGGRENGAVFIPEMLVLRGDLLRAGATAGDRDDPDAQADYGSALAIARQLGTRMSELHALTRLVRSASADARDGWAAECGPLSTPSTTAWRRPTVVAPHGAAPTHDPMSARSYGGEPNASQLRGDVGLAAQHLVTTRRADAGPVEMPHDP